MADVNETRALKASFRGTLDTAAHLAAVQARVERLDDQDDIGDELLGELGRLTAAHAVASAALRGLVNTIMSRRGTATSV